MITGVCKDVKVPSIQSFVRKLEDDSKQFKSQKPIKMTVFARAYDFGDLTVVLQMLLGIPASEVGGNKYLHHAKNLH